MCIRDRATGAYYALLSRTARTQITAAAAMMTYLELSADNTFYDNFTSALFLPHTAIDRFPTVRALLENCLLYTSPSPRDRTRYRMPSSA